MKRAAILVLAIATLVMIVSPSAYSFASLAYPTKSGISAPSVIPTATPLFKPGPSNTGGGTGGGGTDQGDADGLSGLKVKPSQSSYTTSFERIAITMTMWWRYMLLTR